MMSYTPYYAPYSRPITYYNPSVPQEQAPMQSGQQMPIQQPQQMAIQQPMPQMQMVPPALSNDMLWVLNETEAISYPVAPNNSVTLWDKNQDTVYIKSVNMQGVPSMRILDYTERMADTPEKKPDKHVCQCGKDFVRIDVFNGLQEEFRALREELEELKAKPKVKTAKKLIEEAEDNG
jgi:hypothetical protein